MDWSKLVKAFEEMCNEFDVSVKDVNGKYRDFNDISMDLSEAWNKDANVNK